MCIVPGNHEARTSRSEGIDLTEVFAAQLGLSDRYSPTTALLFIRFGKNNKGRRQLYSVYFAHGNGGGRKEGGKINRLADLASIVDADIFCVGHTHLPAVFKEAFYRVSEQNSSVALVEKVFINTNAFLNYGGYGDRAGFKPASKSTPVIYLDGHARRIEVKL